MSRLVIDRARIIDATGSDVVDDGALISIDGKISYVGPRDQAPSVSNAQIVDAEGRWLIPGLIDCHVHLGADAWADFEGEMRRQTVEDAIEVGIKNAKIALANGITAVRDLGGKGDSVPRIADSLRGSEAPRILSAGTWLTRPKGHVHYAGREIDGAEDAIKAVHEQHAAGARCIKVVATGGVLSSGMTATVVALDDETLEAIVNAAGDLGMKVAAHAIGAAGIEAALRAGVDSIEHGNETSAVDRALFFKKPAWLVPTFAAPDGICRCAGIPDFAKKKADEVIPGSVVSFQAAIADGVAIACGSDAGTPDNPVGAIARELELMNGYGLSLMRTLQSATYEAAKLCGFGDAGTLESGKRADMVLLEGDPLQEVGAYSKVAKVFLRGAEVGA